MPSLYWASVESAIERAAGADIQLKVACECGEHVTAYENQFTACASCGRVYKPVVSVTVQVAGPPENAPDAAPMS